MDSRIIPGSKATISHDIYVGDVLVFAKGENIQVEALSQDDLKPDNKYVVLSQRTGKRYLLADADLIQILMPLAPAPKHERTSGQESIEPGDSVVFIRDVYAEGGLAFNKGDVVTVIKTGIPKGETRIRYVLFSTMLKTRLAIRDDVLQKVQSAQSPKGDASPSSVEHAKELVGGGASMAEDLIAAIQPGDHCAVNKDIFMNGQLAFGANEPVLVERLEPDATRPEYKYLVYSRHLQKKFLLSDEAIRKPVVTKSLLPPPPLVARPSSPPNWRVLVGVGIAAVILVIVIAAVLAGHSGSGDSNSSVGNQQDALTQQLIGQFNQYYNYAMSEFASAVQFGAVSQQTAQQYSLKSADVRMTGEYGSSWTNSEVRNKCMSGSP